MRQGANPSSYYQIEQGGSNTAHTLKTVCENIHEEREIEMKMPKKPCLGCIYFKVCGDTTRTKECKGRETKREQKRGKKNDIRTNY